MGRRQPARPGETPPFDHDHCSCQINQPGLGVRRRPCRAFRDRAACRRPQRSHRRLPRPSRPGDHRQPVGRSLGEAGCMQRQQNTRRRHCFPLSGKPRSRNLEALRSVQAILDEHNATATLNLVIADGERIVATRHFVRDDVNSFYVASHGDSHLVASEPPDDGLEWKSVPQHHLVCVTSDTLTTIPLE
jgi:hypothetical protein